MRRLAAGALVFLLSIALPATFTGPRFLVAVWVLIGLAGIALAISSEPVQDRLPAGLRQQEFKLKIEDEKWTTFKYDALILDVKLRIHNRTGHEKHVRSYAFESLPIGPAENPVMSPELTRELWSDDRDARMPPSRVDAKDNVAGWLRYAVARQLDGGTPAYRITLRDEIENDYSVKGKPRKSIRRGLSVKDIT